LALPFVAAVCYTIILTQSLADCIAPPSGLAGWWRAEGNAYDEISGNSGTLVNGAGFARGEVGQAFTFNGANQFVQVPDAPSLNPTNALSLEAWVYLTAFSGNDSTVIAAKEDPFSTRQYQLAMFNVAGKWVFRPAVMVPSGFITGNGTNAVQLNTWYYVAMTYDGSALRLYVNGNPDISFTATGPVNVTANPFRIGSDGSGPWNFIGRIDEVSLYNRALAAAEIQASYAAGAAGKCFTPMPPAIYSQPTNQTVIVGQTANMTIGANGTLPLSYQWNFKDGSIAGATSSSLTLTNVQQSQAGSYTVVITNSAGSVTSSPAILVVNPPPPCMPVPQGLISWWQAEGSGNDLAGLNNGTPTNGVGYAPGVVDQGFSFNGNSSYILVPDSPSLNLTNELTVELWYNFSGTSSQGYGLIAKRAPYPHGCNFGVDVAPAVGGTLNVYFQDPNYPSFQVSSTPAPSAGVFHHIAATFRQATSEQVEVGTYVDGQLVRIAALSGNLARTVNAAPVTIGASDTLGSFFGGVIDEPAIYARALSATEIQAIYNAWSSGKCPTPFPAAIYWQPSSQNVTAGQTATLNVGASGTAPLSYQWTFNGSNIPGATASSLVLADVQTNQAGIYAVEVTNSMASVVSSNAVLSVLPTPACATVPAGLVSWWQAESDANDSLSTNNGTLMNGAGFAQGEVGQAFTFNGANQFVQVPDALSLNPTNALSLEAWVYLTAFSGNDSTVIAAKEDPFSTRQYQLAMFNVAGKWVFRPAVMVPSGFITGNGTNAVQLNTWYYVAMTYDGSALRLYVNGNPDISFTATGPINVTANPFRIGSDGSGPWNFIGRIDEVSLYNRALAAAEIQAIYAAGSSGKCAPSSPVITSQPADQTVTIGQSATFNVVAAGIRPLSYQWTFNGSSIPAATASTLVMTNVQMQQAGVYAVTVTNAAGSTTSSNAHLTVNFPPASVLAETSTPDPTGNVTVPIVLLANGNENALGFSLNFDPTLLSYSSINLGTGATGASLLLNSLQTANGVLGVALSLPTGTSFVAGTQEVVEVTFVTAALTNAAVAQLSFGDKPTGRQLSDPLADALAANFIGGTVSIPAASFEGDVSPRPNGDRAVSITDWVLLGRYAARLDYPTNASEYQRADCAPRSTLGDGAITVADWVQAGRYAVGLDPATRAGGPTNDLGPNVVNLASRPKPSPKGSSRQVRVANVGAVQGQPGVVSVYLDAQGNENALGFSLAFDSTVLSYLSASLGADATGATLVINTNQAAAGHAAFVLELPIGSSFAAGTKEVLKLNLRTAPSAAGLYAVALTDQPVVRQVVDASATPLTTTYINGSISVNPPPSLTATLSQQNINLSWPLWATNFVLQEADGTLLPSLTWSNVPAALTITNNEALVSLPITGTTKFYRLRK
jgi:hypothetical protein